MASDEFSNPDVVHKLIRAAKDKPVNFAFIQGSSPDKSQLGVDRLKRGEQIFAVLKKDVGSSKGCWGRVTSEGSEAIFVCERPLSGIEKNLTEWFRRNKITLKPRIAEEAAADAPQPTDAKPTDAKPADAKTDDARARAGREAEEDEHEEDGADLEDDTPAIFTEPFLKRMLKRARNAPVNFAFGRGKEPELDLLTLHPRKGGMALALRVKQENGATQGAFGTVVVENPEAIFTCEKKPIPGLKKRLRRMFKEWKLPLKPVIFGPDGRFDEPGDEDDDDLAVAADPAQALARLAERLKELLPHLQELVRANPALTDPMRSAYQACEHALKAADLAAAQAAFGQLQGLSGAADAARADTAEDPAITRMRGQLDNARPRLAQIVEQIPARQEDIDRELAAFEAAAAGGDVDAAREAIFALAALAKPPVDAQGEIGAAMQALNLDFRKARLDWNGTRLRVHGQITAFQKAMRDELKDEPDFAEMDQEIAKLDDILTALDDGLELKIDQALSAGDMEAKAALKAEAQALLRGYIDFVRQNPYMARLDANEFMPLTVNADLVAQLSALESTLA